MQQIRRREREREILPCLFVEGACRGPLFLFGWLRRMSKFGNRKGTQPGSIGGRWAGGSWIVGRFKGGRGWVEKCFFVALCETGQAYNSASLSPCECVVSFGRCQLFPTPRNVLKNDRTAEKKLPLFAWQWWEWGCLLPVIRRGDS